MNRPSVLSTREYLQGNHERLSGFKTGHVYEANPDVDKVARVVFDHGPIPFYKACEKAGVPQRQRTNITVRLTTGYPQIYELDSDRNVILDWDRLEYPRFSNET